MPVIPCLRITDYEQARAFYVAGLGFTIDWEHRFEPHMPVFLQLTRGDLTFYLSQHAGDVQPGGLVYLYVPDVDAWYAEMTERASVMTLVRSGAGAAAAVDSISRRTASSRVLAAVYCACAVCAAAGAPARMPNAIESSAIRASRVQPVFIVAPPVVPVGRALPRAPASAQLRIDFLEVIAADQHLARLSAGGR